MKYSFLIFAVLFFSIFQSGCTEDDTMGTVVKPVLSISDAEILEGDAQGKIVFNVTLTGDNSTNVIVSYATVDGTAKAGTDYTSLPDGELIFAPNETMKTIEVTIRGDEVKESDETFEVLLFNPSNATLQRDRATGTIKNDDETGTNPFNVPSGGYTSPLSYPGYTLVWNDEFQSGTLNENIWTHETGGTGWGNNELQYYQPQNSYMTDDEYLVIEAREENVGGSAYTSSRIITKDKQDFQYGRIDIRAALPYGQGLWPALWMLGENIGSVGWPSCGEIDIMELIGNQPSTVHGTVHWSNTEGNHASYGQGKSLASGTFAEEFHVFSIIWDAQSIRWLLDDVEFNVVDTTPADLSEFRQKFFFIFNVAVGGNWPGSPDDSTVFPQRMFVDYVRVFQQ